MGFLNIFGKEKKVKKADKKPKKVEKTVKKAPKKELAKAPAKKVNVLEIDRGIWSIKAAAIIEILGAPKEYVVETLHAYIDKLKKEKDMIVTNETISEVEQKEKLFTVFAEIEFLAKTPSRIVDFCFDYMPSSIEIMEPEAIRFEANKFSNFMNDLQARLHQLDMLVKNLRAENKRLSENSTLILRNNILISLKEKEKDLPGISKTIGIDEENTKKFLDALVKQGIILLKNGKYSLNKAKVKFSE